MTKLAFALVALVVLSTTLAVAEQWVIFSEELPPGANLALHADSQFTIEDRNPFQGANHLQRDLEAGEWSWITGIGGLDLDLNGIDFDNAFIQFYIDSGKVALDYIELRLGGANWNPDSEAIIQTDGIEGYEQIQVFLKDFTVKALGHTAKDLDDLTGGSGLLDRWSIGFSPASKTTVVVDEVVIADSEVQSSQAVQPKRKRTTCWSVVKRESSDTFKR